MIVLDLPLPCPLNRLYRAMTYTDRNGRPVMKHGRVLAKQILSKRARDLRELVIAAIWKQLGGRPQPLNGDVQMAYTVTPRDRRTPDCDAYEKHLLDCLQHAGVIVNDKQVVQVSKERLPTAKRPGGIHVEIWEISDAS